MIEISNGVGHVVFAGDCVSFNEAVKAAIEQGANLEYADLSGADLSGIDFAGVDVAATMFAGSNLQGANFEGVIMYRTDFVGADLRGANFKGARVNTPYWHCANLEGANFEDAFIAFEKEYKQGNWLKYKLVGDSPIFTIPSIGSRYDILCSYRTEGGIFVKTGCFTASLDSFIEAVKSEHSGTKFEQRYLEAVELIKATLA